MITWSRVDNNGEEHIIKQFETLRQFEEYFSNMKDPEEAEMHEDGCWNCWNYDGNHCTKEWNNLDPSYYINWRDDKDPADLCEDWELDSSIKWEEFFEEE